MPKYDRELDAFERDLRAKGYEPLEPFFVLREGQISDERTGGKVVLDKVRLGRIADTQNERVAQTGDATPIIIGHTRRHLLEKDQPEITGLAVRFELAPFLNTKTWGLRATPWTKPENKINFERYKRRSCELWTDPDLIDPISLLGANTPRLDLGLHQLQRTIRSYTPRTPLSLEMNMADDNDGVGGSDKPAEGEDLTAAAGTQTDDFAQLKAQVGELMQMKDLLMPLLEELKQGDPSQQQTPPGGPAAPPPGPQGPAQMMGTPPGGMNSMMPQQFGRDGQPMQFQQVGYDHLGQPLYSVVQQPAQLQQQPLFTPPAPLYTPPARQQTPAPAPQSEVEALRQQVASLQLARMGDEVTLILNDLEKKVVINRPKDHARLLKLSKAERDAEIQDMLATRKQVEPELPPEALPLQFQATPQPLQQTGGPVQMAMGPEAVAYLPGDPNLAKPTRGSGTASAYDALMEIVRNRGKLSPQEAFEAAVGKINTNGAVPVR